MCLHNVVTLQPHQSSQRFINHRLSSRNLGVSKGGGGSDPKQRGVIATPVKASLNDSILYLPAIIYRFPHHDRRPMSDSLRCHGPHGCPHLVHLEVVLSIAVRPDGSVATNDAPDEPHVDLRTFTPSRVGRRAHFKPNVESQAMNVSHYLVQHNRFGRACDSQQEEHR